MKLSANFVPVCATALSLALLAGNASAQDAVAGFYISGGAGINLLDDITIQPVTNGFNTNTRYLTFDNGYAVALAFGARINNAFRIEVEGSYRNNGTDSLTVQNEGPNTVGTGEATALAAMLNGWIDLPTGNAFFQPYFGGGVGVADVNVNAYPISTACTVCVFDGSGTNFAWQVGGGFAIGQPGGPQLTIDFRHFEAGGVSGLMFISDRGTTSDYVAQSVMVGFRLPLGGVN